MRKRIGQLPGFATLLIASQLFAASEARHVVVVVWDGMRPDFITPEYAPTLSELASSGVFFANHHSIYCTATDVNGTAIATGAYPSHSGMIANNMYFPAISSSKAVTVAEPRVMAGGDKLTGGKFIGRPTVAETLQAAGKTTAIAGTKLVALMHDRHERSEDCASVCIFDGKAMPAAAITSATNQLGSFPPGGGSAPNVARDEWSRRALTDVLWSNGVPAFSLLWLSEPDASQHATGPGSERGLAAIKSSDDRLAAVLAALDRHGVRDETDVFVVSDHGFSTVGSSFDVPAILREAGFNARREFASAPQKGDVLVVGQGGSDLFYVIGHDRAVTRRLVQFLQRQEFSGVMFTRDKMSGTFPLSAAHLNRVDNLPDVVMSMRWSADASTNGTPGLFCSDGGRKHAGSHASLSRFDVHNTLVAAGPDFKKGLVNEMPSANTDLAPTILHLLGVKPKAPMDGRILSEALTGQAPKAGKATSKRLEATATNGTIIWRQYLQTSKVNQTIYLDEGNGSTTSKE